ncbi:tetratricopeptide repeat protein [bacterium]|nr:tetratricopeptide repeat protein [bacterium]
MFRINQIKLYVLVCFCGLILYGCGGYIKADLLMSSHKYDDAITLYLEHLVNKPSDIVVRNKLGYAYLKVKKWDNSISEFKRVLREKKGEPYAVLYLGMAYLNKEEYKNAIETWQIFRDKKQPLVEKEISSLLTLLLIKESQIAAEKAIAEEKMLDTIAPDANTIAVCYYEDFSPDKSLRAFQKGLAAMLITDLSKIKTYKVVERLRLQALLEEMKLGQTGIVNYKTAPRVGKLLGAENLIVGSLTLGSIRAISSLSSASKEKIKGTASAKIELNEFYNLSGLITKGILRMLKIDISDEEMAMIGIPYTKNFEAFSYFGQALDELDAGNWKDAKNLFTQAIKADPEFDLAQKGYDACPNDDSPSITALKVMKVESLAKVAYNSIEDARGAKEEKGPEQDGGGGGSH